MSASPTGGGSTGGRRLTRRRLMLAAVGALLIVTIVLARPTLHVLATLWSDVDERESLPAGFIDDASRMNRTAVAELWPIPADPHAAEEQLRELLERAREQELPVSVAGARHSMGGHSISPGGIVVDMRPFDRVEFDEQSGLLHAQTGALWSDVIPYLDQRGLSVAIMQSNNSFTVGGSLSVNCHGWQFGRPPIASSVESFRLMQADGTVVRCSRSESPELFSLALGGYGLFGIILDAELTVVPNERYRLEQFVVPLDEALVTFDRQVEGRSDAAMVYARMSIVADRFLDEVIINVLYRDPAEDGTLPPLVEARMIPLRRSLFRGSVQSDYGKRLRWDAETRLQPHLRQQQFSRNQLLNEGAEVFENRSAAYTDILHEYFVPRVGLVPFVEALRETVPRHKGNLLNVTVRSIDTDDDTLLRYADQPMYSFVMLFHQARTPEGDDAMRAMTVELIDAALAVGGRYYLPYRLHATPEQFRRAYPQAEEFFERKQAYDPTGLFQNQFSLQYGPPR